MVPAKLDLRFLLPVADVFAIGSKSDAFPLGDLYHRSAVGLGSQILFHLDPLFSLVFSSDCKSGMGSTAMNSEVCNFLGTGKKTSLR